MSEQSPRSALGRRGAMQLAALGAVDDGGFAMLMAELSTAVAHNPPLKFMLLKNNGVAEAKFEQRQIGNPENGCNIAPTDCVAVGCAQPDEVRPALQAALNSTKAALVEAVVDVDEKPAKPDELKA